MDANILYFKNKINTILVPKYLLQSIGIYYILKNRKCNDYEKSVKTLGRYFLYIPKFFDIPMQKQYFFALINLNILIIYYY